ncbi:MAG: shikimate kinase [Candidatus Omnitrophica bacterium]|nr:shikimate kinase [Candidatus Omnitrophota bacterium]
MNDKVIILIGFMGAGKSSVAKWLGQTLQRQVLSTDGLIEQKTRLSIRDIFEQQGEVVFRKLENEVLLEIKDQRNIVLDCGGGIVTDQNNLNILKNMGLVFYLSAKPETILVRVKKSNHRPLLNVGDPLKVIKDKLNERDIFYKQGQEIFTDGKTIAEIGEEILERYAECK